MRALRDFNLPKINTEDVTIFMGLIGDLFPALNVPRKRDLEFEDWVKKSIIVRLKCAQDFFQEFSDGGNERKGIVGGGHVGGVVNRCG